MLPIRTCFIFIFIALSCCITTQAQHKIQEDSTLYLFFCGSDKMMDKESYTKNGVIIRNYYSYRINYKNIDYGRIEFIENDLTSRDTLSISTLESYPIKDHQWLKDYFLEYFNSFKGEDPYINKDGTARFFNLNILFKQIYIVQIDSTANQITISKVHHDQYVY